MQAILRHINFDGNVKILFVFLQCVQKQRLKVLQSLLLENTNVTQAAVRLRTPVIVGVCALARLHCWYLITVSVGSQIVGRAISVPLL